MVIKMTETLTVRLDHDTKKAFSDACDTIGVSMGTVVTMLAKTMARTYEIPSEICKADRFYSESNMNYLRGIWNDMQTGKAHFAEHELIEVDDE